MQIDLEQLRELMQAVNEFAIGELEIEKGGERILLRKGGPVVASAPVAAQVLQAAAPAAGGAPAAEASAASEDDPNVTFITSPFVGTFYAAASPDADAFAKVGQTIKPGSVLCIVEAMKLMNEIESEISGEILEILGENGKPVEFGDPLFKIRKS